MKSIVLIEDDQFLQELYRELLGSKFSLEVIGDGLTGKDRLLKGGWDLALVDLTLPGLPGIELLEEVKNDKVKKGTVIVLTNSEDPALLTLAKKVSDAVWIKSKIDPGDFVKKIEDILR